MYGSFKQFQSHPESLRLWNLHNDSILSKIVFKHTTHEPCIYIKYTQTETIIYLLRNVDNFVIACNDKKPAKYLWDQIDTYLKEPFKYELNTITRHDGIEIFQSAHGIKMQSETYLTRA